jgi:two-component system cell cycle sensor histidine kinase/response regulator CckA
VLEQDLRLIAQAADRGTALTSDLLAITRRPVQRAHAIDLDAAVAQAVRLLDRLVAESVAVTLTGAARALPVRIDEGHLSQVLINVATNAADAMPDGGRLDITVEVTTVGRAPSPRRPARGTTRSSPSRTRGRACPRR